MPMKKCFHTVSSGGFLFLRILLVVNVHGIMTAMGASKNLALRSETAYARF
jgi:hypothetical protein